MSKTNISDALLQMIEKIGQASNSASAYMTLLSSLLQIFDLDQGALCEVRGDQVETIFAIDRTRRILTNRDSLWLSRTVMEKALQEQKTVVHRDALIFENGVPKSITEHSLKNVICAPLQNGSRRVIYLASRRDPLREYSPEEMERFHTAAYAAGLALAHHSHLSELKDQNTALENLVKRSRRSLLYTSPEMTQLLDVIKRIAQYNVSILIQGESGSGKEEVAREIHRLSGRKGAFVAVNCANLSETLLESELFGYAKGAFTGATQAKKGLIAEAEGGTFFLDEIAELPLGLQAKLLRTLQERVVRPVGSNQDFPVDIRLLAASHQNLQQAIEEKRFREDLYFRIQEMTIEIPALRMRPDDIELLAHFFVQQTSLEFNFPMRRLSSEALHKLKTYEWPGNVRELKNICRTAVLLSRDQVIQDADIRLTARGVTTARITAPMPAPLTVPGPPPSAVTSVDPTATSQPMTVTAETPPPIEPVYSGPLKELTRHFEKQLIQKLLNEPGETQLTVSRRLDISVRTLQRILQDQTLDC